MCRSYILYEARYSCSAKLCKVRYNCCMYVHKIVSQYHFSPPIPRSPLPGFLAQNNATSSCELPRMRAISLITSKKVHQQQQGSSSYTVHGPWCPPLQQHNVSGRTQHAHLFPTSFTKRLGDSCRLNPPPLLFLLLCFFFVSPCLIRPLNERAHTCVINEPWCCLHSACIHAPAGTVQQYHSSSSSV